MTDERELLSVAQNSMPTLPKLFHHRWSIGQAAALACALEASAPKAGNVHPTASFQDMQFVDFLASGCAIAPVFDSVGSHTVGELVLAGVRTTRAAVGRNTNLGSLLLLAPIGKALDRLRSIEESSSLTHSKKSRLSELRDEVHCILRSLTAEDSNDVYAAIRVANPTGLGSQPEHDIRSKPPSSLVSAMAQVAGIDAVARQYVNDFADIFDCLIPWLIANLQAGFDILESVCRTQVRWLAHEPDGLIVRKSGLRVGHEAQHLAQLVVNSLDLAAKANESEPRSSAGLTVQTVNVSASISSSQEFAALDSFLRADGNRRNPGTTADLLAASLFVLLVCDWS